MKRRPRRIESEVAKWLSLFSSRFLWDPVQRIPILGRTGPDITINQSKLVIDVKSRKSIPLSHIVSTLNIGHWGDLCGVRLRDVTSITHHLIEQRPSVVVERWYNHMDEWTQEYTVDGITALVLHRPGMWVELSTLIIHTKDWRRFYDHIERARRAGGVHASS